MIVLELISGGDLRHYLNSLCPEYVLYNILDEVSLSTL